MRAPHRVNSTAVQGSSDDLKASVPGKPFLRNLLARFRELEQLKQQQEELHDNRCSNRKRTKRLSSTKNLDGGAAAAAEIPADTSAEDFVLTINTQCLFYLQELFRAMLVPVTSDNGLVTQWRVNGMFLDGLDDVEESDLGPASPRKILKLGGYMLEQNALIIHAAAEEANLPAPGSFDLSFFPRLQYLRLDRCDVADIKHLFRLKSWLKVSEMHWHRGLERSDVDGLTGISFVHEWTKSVEETGTYSAWSQLESLSVVNSGLVELDSSLELLPAVKIIRLGQNQISNIAPLKVCTHLQALDLSFNRISSMVDANHVFAQITSLNLSHNMLRSTAGIEKLFALEMLNLSHNAISSISEVGYLVSLPNLHSLCLLGNPIASSSTYRSDVQKLLTNEVTLDDIPWASQDFNDFAKQDVSESTKKVASPRQPTRPASLALNRGSSQRRVNEDSTQGSETARFHFLIRPLLLVGASIVFVQAVVHFIWSRENDTERLLLILLGSLVTLGALVLATIYILSWAINQFIWRATMSESAAASVKLSAQHQPPRVSDRGSFRRFSRRLSTCLVDSIYVEQANTRDGSPHTFGGEMISLDVLRSSLRSLIDSPEELSLLIFLNVCSEIQSMIASLCRTNGEGGIIFAWNTLNSSIAALEASVDELRNVTLQDLLRSAADQATANDSTVHSTTREISTVLEFMSKFLLDLTSAGASQDKNALAASLESAYRHAFTSLHPWLVQKTILDSFATSCPSQRAFYATLCRGNERLVRNDHALTDILRACGSHLHVRTTLARWR